MGLEEVGLLRNKWRRSFLVPSLVPASSKSPSPFIVVGQGGTNPRWLLPNSYTPYLNLLLGLVPSGTFCFDFDPKRKGLNGKLLCSLLRDSDTSVLYLP